MNKKERDFFYKNYIEVYASKINLAEPFSGYEHFLSSISEEKQERIAKFRFEIDKLRCLKAELLVRKVLIKKLGLSSEDIVFKTNKFGKPSLVNSEVEFNISHSGDWVVCAVSNQPVGVDIEKILQTDLSIANRFFSNKEVEFLDSQPESQRQNYFFDIWTLKESFIKAVGEGLAIPLDSFSVIKDKASITLYSDKYSGYHFKQYEIDAAYKLSLCCINNNFPEKVFLV